jgi:hypothetical protein
MNRRWAVMIGGVLVASAAFAQTVRDHRTPKPDLVITAIVQDPPNPIANQSWRFLVTIKNNGSADASFPNGAQYMGHSTNGGGFTPITAGQAITIPPGGTYTGIQYPGNASAGTFPVTFKVDPSNVVAETDESNNSLTSSYTIGAAGKPDLAITSITLEPAMLPSTANAKLQVTIKNEGTGVADLEGGGRYIIKSVGADVVRKTGVMNLLPGASMTVVCEPARLVGGSNTWNLMVDPDNLVAETNESNNTKSLTASLVSGGFGHPDLIITQITTDPAQPTVANNGKFIVTLKNQGTAEAIIPDDWPYMDETVQGPGSTTTPNGIKMTGGLHLAPGATVNGIKYHAVTGPGTYTITFRADSDNVVPESNEGNNAKALTFTVK